MDFGRREPLINLTPQTREVKGKMHAWHSAAHEPFRNSFYLISFSFKCFLPSFVLIKLSFLSADSTEGV